jgi:hypothetical protein
VTELHPSTVELWLKLIRGLEGTCFDLPEEYEHLWDDMEFCQMVDARIFRCEGCDWWHENSEKREEGNQHGICRECCET